MSSVTLAGLSVTSLMVLMTGLRYRSVLNPPGPHTADLGTDEKSGGIRKSVVFEGGGG